MSNHVSKFSIPCLAYIVRTWINIDSGLVHFCKSHVTPQKRMYSDIGTLFIWAQCSGLPVYIDNEVYFTRSTNISSVANILFIIIIIINLNVTNIC